MFQRLNTLGSPGSSSFLTRAQERSRNVHALATTHARSSTNTLFSDLPKIPELHKLLVVALDGVQPNSNEQMR